MGVTKVLLCPSAQEWPTPQGFRRERFRGEIDVVFALKRLTEEHDMHKIS